MTLFTIENAKLAVLSSEMTKNVTTDVLADDMCRLPRGNSLLRPHRPAVPEKRFFGAVRWPVGQDCSHTVHILFVLFFFLGSVQWPRRQALFTTIFSGFVLWPRGRPAAAQRGHMLSTDTFAVSFLSIRS